LNRKAFPAPRVKQKFEASARPASGAKMHAYRSGTDF
jgi:hypothetical protein